jgi:hypothetical protein
MNTSLQPRKSALEIFLSICFVTVIIMAFGAIFYGFREVLGIIDTTDPVTEWMLTAFSNILFALALLFFIVLVGSLIWKRLIRRS